MLFTRLAATTFTKSARPPGGLKLAVTSVSSSLSTTTSTLLSSPLSSIFSTRASFFGTKPPSADPLALIREECHRRNLCDELGFRRPGVHWVFSVAVSADDTNLPPILKTVGVQRVSSDGIDFVMKKGSGTCDTIATGRPIAILHLQGRYLPGESAEQWRGEGSCQRLPLDGDLLDLLPAYTVASMVSSKRMEKMSNGIVQNDLSGDRQTLENRSKAVEIEQLTRRQLEQGEITDVEIDDAIRAFRFQPRRLECMLGGPDSIKWERWEWSKDISDEWEGRPLHPH